MSYVILSSFSAIYIPSERKTYLQKSPDEDYEIINPALPLSIKELRLSLGEMHLDENLCVSASTIPMPVVHSLNSILKRFDIWWSDTN